jgi:altronate hydrolase
MPAVATAHLLRLHPDDNVLIATRMVAAGTPLPGGAEGVVTGDVIDLGHKVAVRGIRAGEAVRKFGQMIGYAARDVAAGEWVHSHNLTAGELSLDYAYASEVPVDPEPIGGRTFEGYRRADGRAATRNYVAVITTVNCAASTAKYIAARLDRTIADEFEHVDGIVAIKHEAGCAFQFAGEDHQQLTRVLAGYAKHANIGAFVVVGLGCETGHPSYLFKEHGLVQLEGTGDPSQSPLCVTIQDTGGVARTVDRVAGQLREMLPEVNRARRVPIPVSELIVGTECGGSDGNSGVTANPAVGICSDLLVAHGGTTVLAETTEIYGAEHMLTRRAVCREVGEKLVERIRWWEEHVAKFGVEIDNNPSIGNKRGGLTTIYEKSLGAIAKGGSTALKQVYRYAEPITEKGFVVMDTPGFDPPSVTGMIAGGANVIVFTTGRGSCFGSKPSPTIKVCTNTPTFEKLPDDMDVNAGTILDGGASVEEVGREIFEKVIRVASGEKTKSELQGFGDEEFVPWRIGPML